MAKPAQSIPEINITSVKRELAKRCLSSAMIMMIPTYQLEWFHEVLCNKLDKVYTGEIKRLIVQWPPQHGKSTIVSEGFPATALGRNPNLRIGNAAYSATKAEEYNRHTQAIIDTPEYHELFPDTLLAQSSVHKVVSKKIRRDEMFEIVGHKGFYKTVGVNGPLTGTAIDIGIIDDPVKDSVEAESFVYRDRVWNWYTDVFNTRLHNDSRVIVCMTRWHQDDLVGRILKHAEESGEKWEVISFPAIKEDNTNPEDPRLIGDALWPERHSLDKLRKVEKESPRTFAALYRQNPRPVKVGGEAYYAFNMNKHVAPVEYDSGLPLHITFDFNIHPYTTCNIWQIKKQGTESTAIQVDEICLPDPARTKGVCMRFLEKYFHGLGHTSGLYVYGDPNGRKEDTSTEKGYNNYKQVEKYLAPMHPSVRVETVAPFVDTRIGWINDVLDNNYGGLSIQINPKCIKTTDDYQFVKTDPQGGKLKEKGMVSGVPKLCEIMGHTSDANDYFLCTVFKNDYQRWQRGGTPVPATTHRVVNKSRKVW